MAFSSGREAVARLEIPWKALSEEALRGVIEEFVTREGTEYGVREVDLPTRCEQVGRQLRSGRARITYDDETSSCTIAEVK